MSLRLDSIPGLWPKDRMKEKPLKAPVKTERDLRLDLFRGVALWLIFLDHIPSNAVSWITIRNYGFSDATEIFVFISGYAAAFVYDQAVVDHIVSMCNDPDSGGRMVDNIITNTLLPALSREFLKRSIAKEELKEAKITIENGEFSYSWA